jgi:outer membrane protein
MSRRWSSYRPISTVVGMVAGVSLTVVLGACAHHDARWTPESVRPPESLDAALTQSAAPETSPLPTAKEAGAAETSEADAAETTEDGLEITRDGALLTALTNNRSLQVSRFGPAIGETYVPEARAVFDPRLLAAVSYGKDTRQLAGVARYTIGRGATEQLMSVLPELSPVERIAAQAASHLATGSSQLVDNYEFARGVEQQVKALVLDIQNKLGLTKEVAFESKTSEGSLRASNYLPTGTEVFLSGGMTRDQTSFTPADYVGSWTAGINQALLKGAGTAVNLAGLRKARNTAAQSRHAFRGSVLDLVEQVEAAYWELALAEELLRIREFSVRLAKEQRETNQNLVDVGKAIEGAVIASEAEVSSRQADLADAKAHLRAQTLAMIRLLNPELSRDWETRLDPTDGPDVEAIPVSGETSAELALLYRPELAESRLDLANRELDVVQTKNGLLPRLDAFATYGRTSLTGSSRTFTQHLDDSDYENYAFGIEFEMPLLNRAERARHRRSQYALESAEAAIANLEQLLELDARSAVVEVERQQERIAATQAAVRSRQEDLRIQRDRYSVGKSTNLDILQVQRDLIAAQVAEVTARVRYIQALTALYAAEGTLLERRGVEIEDYL